MAKKKSIDRQRLYAWAQGDRLFIDGVEAGPWLRLTANAFVYADSTVEFRRHILPLFTKADTAIGSPFEVTGANLVTETGTLRVFLGDTWGLDRRNAATYAKELEAIVTAARDNGVEWRPTAGNTAMVMLAQYCKEHMRRGIDPRWRSLAYAGIHAGPIIHASGGGKRVAHIDRNKAYAAAMLEPLPGKTLVDLGKRDPLECDCIVACDVMMPDLDIPILPLTLQDATVVYPVGHIRGVWPSNLLRVAIQNGAKITSVRGGFRWLYKEPYMQPYTERVLSLPKHLGKPLYTRTWGKLCSMGRWTGSKDTGWIEGSGLKWTHEVPDETKRLHPQNRPEIAAWIVGNNHAEMMRAIQGLDSIVAAHVDAIWTADTAGAAKLVRDNAGIGGWKLEDQGETRYYSVGQYHTIDKATNEDVMGFAGWQGAEDPTVEVFRKWASDPNKPPTVSREWSKNPREHMSASSVPHRIDGDPDYRVYSGNDPFCAELWDKEGKLKGTERNTKEHGAGCTCIDCLGV